MGGKPRAVFHARSDGWLLAAMTQAAPSGLASWRSIIGSADYMDHAVPTFDQLAGAVARLAARGFIAVQPGGVEVSDAVRERVDVSTNLVRRRYAAVSALAAATDGQQPTELASPVRRDHYDAAIADYRGKR